MHVTPAFVLAAILRFSLYANLCRLPRREAEDGRGSSGIGRGKSIEMTEGILLPAEAVDSNRSRPMMVSTVSAFKQNAGAPDCKLAGLHDRFVT